MMILTAFGPYIGAICVIYGTHTYKSPAGSWPGDMLPPVSPAVGCTMILFSMYFLAYSRIRSSIIFQFFSGVDVSKLTGALWCAICSMFFAPFLLEVGFFIGAVRVIYGTYTYSPPAGFWPPVPPTAGCTLILSSMYFMKYAGIHLSKTFQSFSDASKLMGALQGSIHWFQHVCPADGHNIALL